MLIRKDKNHKKNKRKVILLNLMMIEQKHSQTQQVNIPKTNNLHLYHLKME